MLILGTVDYKLALVLAPSTTISTSIVVAELAAAPRLRLFCRKFSSLRSSQFVKRGLPHLPSVLAELLRELESRPLVLLAVLVFGKDLVFALLFSLLYSRGSWGLRVA